MKWINNFKIFEDRFFQKVSKFDFIFRVVLLFMEVASKKTHNCQFLRYLAKYLEVF